MALVKIDRNPDRKRLRVFALAATVVFAALGTWVYVRHNIFGADLAEETAEWVGTTLWEVAAVCGLAALLVPGLLRPLYLLLTLMSLPIGWVVSHVAMGVVYYLVLAPIGLAMRLLGRDPLHRRFEPDAKTYWVRRDEQDAKAGRYFRQF